MELKFKPFIKTLGFFNPQNVYTMKEIRNEQMFFSCTPEFIRKYSSQSPITNDILNNIPLPSHTSITKDKYSIVVDTRVNMLMKGQYPSIPGWHCDDVPRDYTGTGQPLFDLCDPIVQHYMVLVSDNPERDKCVSGTQFVSSEEVYSVDPECVWNSLNKSVEADTNKEVRSVREREIVFFDQHAIHRATPATTSGWRLFFRLSLTHRKPQNTIRNQVQVYVDVNEAGW